MENTRTTFQINEVLAIVDYTVKSALTTFYRNTEPLKDTISQNMAYQEFGEAKIKSLVNLKMITSIKQDPSKRNSKKCFSRSEIIVALEKLKLKTKL